MSTESFYTILGVSEKASKDEIKKAFRSLSLQFHPDKTGGATVEKFQKINEAYETLGDEEKRQQYDMTQNNPFLRGGMNMGGMHMGGMHMGGMPFGMQFAHMGGMPFAHMGSMPFGNMGGGGGGGQEEIDELLSNLFGASMGMPPGANIRIFRSGPGGSNINISQQLSKPEPINKNLEITMEQVLTGSTVPIDIERWIVEKNMKVFEKETLYITIPKGIDDNEMIVIENKGNSINENCKGDVKIFIKIINNTEFERNGLDLLIKRTISLKEALCGFQFELKYINGKSYTLKNNSGNIITPDYKKIIPDMGLTRDTHVGDLIIQFNVEFPKSFTEETMNKLKEIL
jgi:DnaJ family protein A protein 2